MIGIGGLDCAVMVFCLVVAVWALQVLGPELGTGWRQPGMRWVREREEGREFGSDERGEEQGIGVEREGRE